ncbi:unnamed protein product, partial [Brachionus calyciflorus]
MDQISEQFSQLNLPEKGFVTKSQKNLPQLHFEDHFFRLNDSNDANKNNLNGKNIKWRCTYSTCLVKCQTNGCIIGEYYDILNFEGQHVEAPDTTKLAKLEYRRKITELATSSEAPRKIVLKAKTESLLTEEQMACAPS